jgi:hypothetical protein
MKWVEMHDTSSAGIQTRLKTAGLFALAVTVAGLFILNKITLLGTPPPENIIDYSQFPWYEIPVQYVINYTQNAWSSLLFAFFLGGFIQEFTPKGLIEKHLGSHALRSYFLAVLLAPIMITCSCSVIPIYVSILVSGASLGVAMTFFLMAPAANFITVLLTGEYLGWDLGILRLIFSAIAAIISGYVFDRTKLAQDLVKQYREMRAGKAKRLLQIKTLDDRISSAYNNIWALMKGILSYLLIGLVVVSYIAAYLPEESVVLFFSGFWGIFFGALLGGPLYTPALVEIVLTSSLISKGMARSAALAFMMGQPYDFVSMPPNSRYFKWKGVLIYTVIFFVASITAGVFYTLVYGWI